MIGSPEEKFNCSVVTKPYPTEKYAFKWSIQNVAKIFKLNERTVWSPEFKPFGSVTCNLYLEKKDVNIHCVEVSYTYDQYGLVTNYEIEANLTVYNSAYEVLVQKSCSKENPPHKRLWSLLLDPVELHCPLPEDEFSIVFRTSAIERGYCSKIVS